MKPRLGITPKLTLIFVGFAALLLAGVASLAYINGHNALQQAAISELQSIATEKDSALTEWEQGKQTAVQTLASLPELQRALAAFRSAPAGSVEAQAAHDQLIGQLSPWAGDDKDFLGLLVMNPDTAEIIAATRADEEGKFKETFPYFIHGREGFFLQSAYYSPELQDVAMTVSVPVKAANGRLLGVLAGRLNLDQLNAIIQRRSGLHQTDDVFLISASNLFVTQPRFISDPAVLKRGIHTESIKRCLLHEDGTLAYPDYRGEPVISVYRWLPEFDICLLVKLDQAEAFEPSYAFGQTILILSLATLAVALVLAVGLARTIVWPLQSLQSGVVRFGQGDLDARLPETSMDELGVLAREFNQMAVSLAEKDAQLREYATQLEQKVDERTAALRESESLKASILKSALDCIITINHQGRIIEFNPAAQKTFGYSLDEVLGKEMVELIIPPTLREQHRHGLESYLASGESKILGKRLELTGMRADGTEFPVELTIARIKGDGPPVFTGFLRDITERKRAEQSLKTSEERFRLIVEAAPSAIIAVDSQGKINLVNARARELFGYQPQELLGRPVEMLVPERFRTRHPNYRQGFAAKPSSRAMGAGRDLFGLHKDGHEIPIEIGLTPYKSSEGQFTLALIVDISERKQMEEKLRENEERYSRFFENMHEIFVIQEIITDHDGKPIDLRFVDVNPAAERFMGKTRNEIVGRTRSQLSGHPDHEGVEMASRVASTGTPFHMVRYSPGFGGWFESFTYSLGSGIVATLSLNITERKEAEKALERMNEELEIQVKERTAALSQANSLLQMMLDQMPDHIYFKDVQSRFIRNSMSQARALGLSDPAEAVGKSDFDFFPHAQLSYEKEQEIIRSGKPLVDEEERVVWPDGRETWVSTTKVPLPDQTGQIIGTFGISRDITERKRSEEALQKAKLELEATNRELEAFSYSVSHDLRSPLRSVDGFSQALLEDYGDLLPPEGRNFLERVRSSAQRMAALIDDLLNLSRVTRVPIKSVPVDLTRLAENIAAELKRTHPEHSVKFNIAPNLKVRGDPQLLQVVLENFMNNAWKFTSKREKPEIEFRSKRENNETVYFVRDNGAGFDMAYANKLFGAFQRLHTVTEFPGTGIGLATVQRIIHRHGGRVWAEGAVDKGATFFFTVPTLERVKPEAVPQEKESLAKRVKEII